MSTQRGLNSIVCLIIANYKRKLDLHMVYKNLFGLMA